MMRVNTHEFIRNDGRTSNQVRPLSLQYDQFGYADCSVLFSIGGTRVQVSITLQDGVPVFLRNSGTGWLTAEYAMLPTATQKRTQRETDTLKKQGRSVEIARLIGRCLRSVIDFKSIGERTIIIDCDVLQADGGTRAACITAASFALTEALKRWKKRGVVAESVQFLPIAAISGGVVEGRLIVDLSQTEDMKASADVVFVCTEQGELIEVQGTSEKGPLTWTSFVSLKEACCSALSELFLFAHE